jgi:hypothetical protein
MRAHLAVSILLECIISVKVPPFANGRDGGTQNEVENHPRAVHFLGAIEGGPALDLLRAPQESVQGETEVTVVLAGSLPNDVMEVVGRSRGVTGNTARLSLTHLDAGGGELDEAFEKVGHEAGATRSVP